MSVCKSEGVSGTTISLGPEDIKITQIEYRPRFTWTGRYHVYRKWWKPWKREYYGLAEIVKDQNHNEKDFYK